MVHIFLKLTTLFLTSLMIKQKDTTFLNRRSQTGWECELGVVLPCHSPHHLLIHLVSKVLCLIQPSQSWLWNTTIPPDLVWVMPLSS